jgi:hypothetical protein
MGTGRRHGRARREVLDAYDAIDRAEGRLREQLRRSRKLLEISRRHLENNGSAGSLRDLMDIKDVRGRNDAALRELNEARADAQFALYRLAAEEGMSAAEIGRTFGVSRQFVSRVLNDSRPPRRRVGRPASRVGSRGQSGPAES